MPGVVQLEGKIVRQAEARVAVKFGRVVIAVTDPGLAAELLGGFFAGDVDHTADGVSAEERALGTAKHLNPLHVDQLGQRARGLAQKQSVDHHAHGRVEAALHLGHADTPDVNGGHATGPLSRVVDNQVGGDVGEIVDIAGESILDFGGTESAHGLPQILEAFFALAGGYHHLLQGTGILLILGQGIRRAEHHGGTGECNRRCQGRSDFSEFVHGYSPVVAFGRRSRLGSRLLTIVSFLNQRLLMSSK